MMNFNLFNSFSCPFISSYLALLCFFNYFLFFKFSFNSTLFFYFRRLLNVGSFVDRRAAAFAFGALFSDDTYTNLYFFGLLVFFIFSLSFLYRYISSSSNFDPDLNDTQRAMLMSLFEKGISKSMSDSFHALKDTINYVQYYEDFLTREADSVTPGSDKFNNILYVRDSLKLLNRLLKQDFLKLSDFSTDAAIESSFYTPSEMSDQQITEFLREVSYEGIVSLRNEFRGNSYKEEAGFIDSIREDQKDLLLLAEAVYGYVDVLEAGGTKLNLDIIIKKENILTDLQSLKAEYPTVMFLPSSNSGYAAGFLNRLSSTIKNKNTYCKERTALPLFFFKLDADFLTFPDPSVVRTLFKNYRSPILKSVDDDFSKFYYAVYRLESLSSFSDQGSVDQESQKIVRGLLASSRFRDSMLDALSSKKGQQGLYLDSQQLKALKRDLEIPDPVVEQVGSSGSFFEFLGSIFKDML